MSSGKKALLNVDNVCFYGYSADIHDTLKFLEGDFRGTATSPSSSVTVKNIDGYYHNKRVIYRANSCTKQTERYVVFLQLSCFDTFSVNHELSL